MSALLPQQACSHPRAFFQTDIFPVQNKLELDTDLAISIHTADPSKRYAIPLLNLIDGKVFEARQELWKNAGKVACTARAPSSSARVYATQGLEGEARLELYVSLKKMKSTPMKWSKWYRSLGYPKYLLLSIPPMSSPNS